MQSKILNLKSEILSSLFITHRELLTRNDPPAITALREEALRSFVSQGFPTTRLEGWQQTDLRQILAGSYDVPLEPEPGTDIHRVFRCTIPHLDTAIMGQLNGWYAPAGSDHQCDPSRHEPVSAIPEPDCAW